MKKHTFATRPSKNSRSTRVAELDQGRPATVIVGGQPTAYAIESAKALAEGVRVALDGLAKKRLSTVAEVEGEIVSGIPARKGTRFSLVKRSALHRK